MTESEWLECTDPTPILEFLRGKVSDRKLRFFACACCRSFWQFLTHKRSRGAVEFAERYADQLADRKERRRMAVAAMKALKSVSGLAMRPLLAAQLTTAVHMEFSTGKMGNEDQEELRVRCRLLRCILGNPFRPITINSAWLNPTVTTLATAAYEERILPSGELDHARLAVLSDALEEAGCDDADILAHLRSPGPHVRGCWAVDLILGKE